jgi:hypothetical protein
MIDVRVLPGLEPFVTFDESTNDDGEHVVRRFEGGVLQGETRSRSFPGGRACERSFDAKAGLMQEIHRHECGLTLLRDFSSGCPTGETYLRGRRLITRKAYERDRQGTDMPAADPSKVDLAAELRAGRRAESSIAKVIAPPDPLRAAAHDAFCARQLAMGRCMNAEDWLGESRHAFDGMSSARSRQLVRKLREAGAVAVHACDVQSLGDRVEGSDRIVIALPEADVERRGIFAIVARRVAPLGFEAPPDDGQCYLFLQLA